MEETALRPAGSRAVSSCGPGDAWAQQGREKKDAGQEVAFDRLGFHIYDFRNLMESQKAPDLEICHWNINGL
jgi:hypothetical protein